MSQVGKFYAGTYGYPIIFKVGANLSEVTFITLDIIPPKGSTISQNLDLDTVTNETEGVVEYTLQDGDLPIPGNYQMRLSFSKSGNRKLVAAALMIVG